MTSVSGIARLRPHSERDARPDVDSRLDLELVDQPACARETKPKAVTGREAILHRLLDVTDARPRVDRRHEHAALLGIRDRGKDDLPTPGVNHEVARDFSDCRCERCAGGR
jgi:hypothetical protein